MKFLPVLFAVLFAMTTNTSLAGSSTPPNLFSVCFDFSCKNTQQIKLSQKDWNQVVGLFYLNGNPEEERVRIKEAVATLESLVGQYAPTYRDVGQNWSGSNDELNSLPGQMDCIDESINTTTYLKLLENSGLLKFHLVRDRVERRSVFRTHWAAQIVDVQTGQKYVVDSWFRDNGEVPYLVKGETWHDLSLF